MLLKAQIEKPEQLLRERIVRAGAAKDLGFQGAPDAVRLKERERERIE